MEANHPVNWWTGDRKQPPTEQKEWILLVTNDVFADMMMTFSV